MDKIYLKFPFLNFSLSVKIRNENKNKNETIFAKSNNNKLYFLHIIKVYKIKLF